MATDTSEPETTESVSAYTKAEQAHYEQIRELERQVADLETVADRAKSAASVAKKAFESADEKLRTCIRRGPEVQATLLFGDDEAVKSNWREMPVTELVLSDSIHDALREANLITLGGLSDFMAAHGEQWWRDVDSIGEQKAVAVADAFAAFWEEHPEFCGVPGDPEDPDGE